MMMNKEDEFTGTVPLIYARKRGQKSTSAQRSLIGGATCLGILVALAYLGFGSFTRWISQGQLRRGLQTQATRVPSVEKAHDNIFRISMSSATTAAPEDISTITHSANLISLRGNSGNDDGAATEDDQDDNTQTMFTDTDGTWVIVTSQEYTDADGNTYIPATQDQPSSQTTITTIETTSLTDHIIISWRTTTETTTLDHFVTITVTGKDAAQNPSGTTTTATTENPQLSSPQRPSTIPSSPATCPYLTCAPTCPWNTCPISPTVMNLELCQMIDACWFNGPSRSQKPPSQGGRCACLCESGYCNGKLSGCGEKNCCHECECFPDNPMSLQHGDGC